MAFIRAHGFQSDFFLFFFFFFLFFFLFFFASPFILSLPPVKLSVEITLYFPHRWTTLLSTRDNARSTPSVSNSVQGLLKRRRRKNSLRRSSPLFIHLQTFADYCYDIFPIAPSLTHFVRSNKYCENKSI